MPVPGGYVLVRLGQQLAAALLGGQEVGELGLAPLLAHVKAPEHARVDPGGAVARFLTSGTASPCRWTNGGPTQTTRSLLGCAGQPKDRQK